MKTEFRLTIAAVVLAAFNFSSTPIQAQFTYVTNKGGITITGYHGPGGNVPIPPGISGRPVVSIGEGAFAGCSNVTSVTIPSSVISVGFVALSGCSSLTSIVVNPLNPYLLSLDGVLLNKQQNTVIQCPGGKPGHYTVPDSVSLIENYAFSGCSRLTDVALPNSVTSIGEGAFSHCTRLTSMRIPDKVTGIADRAFAACSSLTSITLPSRITIIGAWAFSGCSNLTSVALPDSIIRMGRNAFSYCSRLTGVTLPGSLTSIAEELFAVCTSLTTVTIPNNVTNIGNSAFQSCANLTSVTVPDSVTAIGESAFYDCTRLTSVTLGSSVRSLGDSEFLGCRSLTGVYFRGNAPACGASLFAPDTGVIVYYLVGSTGWGRVFGGRPTAVWAISPSLALTRTVAAGMMTLTWGTTNGFRLQKTTNFVHVFWEDIPESEATNTLTLPIPQPAAFFRLVNGPKPIAPPAGLVAWWTGDGNALDSVGTNHGTLRNGTRFTSGMVGQAFQFDGLDDQMRAPTVGLPIGTADRTIEFWFVFTEVLTDESMYAGYGAPGQEGRLWRLGVGQKPPRAFWTQGSYTAYGKPVEVGLWHHIAATSDAGFVTLYLDGEATVTAIVPFDTPAGTDFVMGCIANSCKQKGTVDEVCIYNRALTSDEIKAVYEARGGGKIKPFR